MSSDESPEATSASITPDHHIKTPVMTDEMHKKFEKLLRYEEIGKECRRVYMRRMRQEKKNRTKCLL